MSALEPPQPTSCPSCGAEIRAGLDRCWNCGAAIGLPTETARNGSPPATDAVSPAAGESPAAENPFLPPSPPPGPRPFQFSLSTLLLLTTLAAVVFGGLAFAPPLGLVLAILFTPALVWTAIVESRRRAKGEPTGGRHMIRFFLKTLAIVTAIAVSAGIAFYVTCWVGFFGGAAVSSPFAKGYDSIGYGLLAGVILGLAVGIFVIVLLVRKIWPRGD